MSTSEIAKHLPRRSGSKNTVGAHVSFLVGENGFERMVDSSNNHRFYRYNPEVAE